jgi:hypothetical protein
MITHFRHTTVGRTPLDEGSARRRDLYLTSDSTHKRQTSMPPVGFFFPFDPFCTFKSFRRPSCHFTFHATVLTTNTTDRHPCPRREFFFVCPGFFPFDPFLYCLNPFRPACHFTFHATVLTTNTTDKHPCPRRDSNPRS